jgi:hypothetical protein
MSRSLYPGILRKQDRGNADISLVPKVFGDVERGSISFLEPDKHADGNEDISEPPLAENLIDYLMNIDLYESDTDFSSCGSDFEESDEEDDDDSDESDDILSEDHIDTNFIDLKSSNSRKNSLDIEDVQMIKRLKSHNLQVSDNRSAVEDSDDSPRLSGLDDYIVDPESLQASRKITKLDKISRITQLMQKKSEVKPFEHGGHRGGLTNKEKERKKNYLMVRRGKNEVTKKLLQSSHDTRYKRNNAVRERTITIILVCVLLTFHSSALQKKPFGRDKRKRRRV